MDITESFRPEDISKTDFFDFVTTPDSIGIGINDRVTGDTNGVGLDAPLQGFDQVSALRFAVFFFPYFLPNWCCYNIPFLLCHCL